MADPTVLSVTQILGPFEAVSAGAADFTLAAGTITDGDVFACTGREILIVHNSGLGAATITIKSESDDRGRTGDIASYSLAAGDYSVFGVGLTTARGWKNASGKIRITVSSADLLVAVLRLPSGVGA